MKFKVSELFYSAQGEGRYVGVPSVFLRMFGCNFTCSGFGCKKGEKSTEADEVQRMSTCIKRLKNSHWLTQAVIVMHRGIQRSNT
jgi:organic radical activating enzyme